MRELTLDHINCKTPYKVGMARKGTYLFHTETDVVYSIMFQPDMEIAGSQTYQFVIDRLSESKDSHPGWVKDTIIAIICEFFEQNNDILLYICDTDDGREAMRNRLFLRWFSEGADESHFTIKTAHCLVEQQMFYTAIIIRNDHPNYSAVISEFDMTATELSNKPQA